MFKTLRSLIKTIIFLTIVAIGIGVVITTLYPIGYKDIINKYSKEYDVDPFLVAAIINVESKYDKDAISNKDARGLMQIMPATGEWAAEVLQIKNYNLKLLHEPEINIKLGAWYISQLKKEFNNNMELVYASYNAGSGNVGKWLQDKTYSIDGKSLEDIPFNQTKEYVEKVNFNYNMYKIVYNKYMEKPDNSNSIYINVIILIRALGKKLLSFFR